MDTGWTTIFKSLAGWIFCLAVWLGAFAPVQALAQWPLVVSSKDGTPISCEIYGAGEPTLVFVHGWSCDARYWRAQIPHFSKRHRVAVLDLAGHGHSGSTRFRYTMASFGEDVRYVTEATGGKRVILIGHSMGGSVIAEAARLMPERVIGLIGVDTLENVEYAMTAQEFEKMIAPLEKRLSVMGRERSLEGEDQHRVRNASVGIVAVCCRYMVLWPETAADLFSSPGYSRQTPSSAAPVQLLA